MVDKLTTMFAAKSWWYNAEEDVDTSIITENIRKDVECTATLYKHQELAVDWLMDKKEGAMLSLTMGLGKSLTVLYHSVIQLKADSILLVVSKSLIPNWTSMINQFFPNLTFDILHSDNIDPRKYNNSDRKQLIITTYDVVMSMASLHDINILVNREERGFVSRNVDTLLSSGPGSFLFNTHFDVVISDESQIFRNPCGQLYPAMMGLTGKKYICLTATPIQNSFDDLYTQFRFMNINQVQRFEIFNEEFFQQNNLADNVLIMDYKDAGINLPGSNDHVIKLFYNEHEKEAYRLLREEALSNIKKKRVGYEKDNEQKDRTIKNIQRKKPIHILALITRLRFACMCIGLGYRSKNMMSVPKRIRPMLRNPQSCFWTNSTKFVAVRKIIAEIVERKEKVIIFSTFLTALKEFGEGLKQCMGIHPLSVEGCMDIEYRQSMIDTFKTSQVHSVMLLTFQIGAEGMNLIEANNIIILDYWWSPSAIKQAIARALRIGQTKIVNIYRFRMADTIEDRVYEIVQKKSEIVEQFESGVISNDTYKSII